MIKTIGCPVKEAISNGNNSISIDNNYISSYLVNETISG